jgi:glycine/D-amino acid oxidase-like deaminating enzyme
MPARVVVIGAGVYGAAVARELTRRGAAVTVVDHGRPAGGTSGATFSWVNSNNKRPRPYHDLNVAGMAAHRRFAEQMGEADWYHGGGNLEWPGDAAGRDLLAEKVDRLRADQYPVRWLDRAEVCRLEPDMAAAEVPGDGVAFFPGEGWVEPTRLVAVLLGLARQAGATVITGDPVTGIAVGGDTAGGDTVGAVRLRSGESIPVDAVVNCAGPNAGAVAGLAGLSLPMRNTSGVLAYLQPVPVAVRRVVHAPRIHLRPDGGGRLLLHTGEFDNAATRDDEGAWSVPPEATRTLVEETARLYPGTAGATVEAVRVGVRPIPADGLPVIGRAAGVKNFHFAVSHSGATLCLRVAELLAPEILGAADSPELASFRHARLVTRAATAARGGG